MLLAKETCIVCICPLGDPVWNRYICGYIVTYLVNSLLLFIAPSWSGRTIGWVCLWLPSPLLFLLPWAAFHISQSGLSPYYWACNFLPLTDETRNQMSFARSCSEGQFLAQSAFLKFLCLWAIVHPWYLFPYIWRHAHRGKWYVLTKQNMIFLQMEYVLCLRCFGGEAKRRLIYILESPLTTVHLLF